MNQGETRQLKASWSFEDKDTLWSKWYITGPDFWEWRFLWNWKALWRKYQYWKAEQELIDAMAEEIRKEIDAAMLEELKLLAEECGR